MVQLVRHLLDAGLVRTGDGGGLQASFDQLVLPLAAARRVTAHAARRGADTIDVLQIASVVGDEFDGSLVKSLTKLNDEAFNGVVAGATGAGLVVELPGERIGYAFTHPFARRELADSVEPERRTELHGQIAEGSPAGPGRVTTAASPCSPTTRTRPSPQVPMPRIRSRSPNERAIGRRTSSRITRRSTGTGSHCPWSRRPATTMRSAGSC